MKLTLTRDVLLPALTRVKNAVQKRTTVPILGNVMIRAIGDQVTFFATDLDAEMSTTVAAEVTTQGETTLPAHTLFDFVRKVASGRSLTLADDGASCAITAGRTRVVLHSLPAADFPSLSSIAPAATFTLPAARLADILARTRFAVSTEETRYYLNGIHLHAGDDEGQRALHAVATDGHRLAHETLPLPAGAETLPAIIIPKTTVDMLAHLLRTLENVDVEISASASHISLAAGPTRLTSKLVDGTFPNYGRVIPTGGTSIVVMEADALKASVELLATIASDRGRAIKLAFGAEPGTLNASVSNPDAGTASDTVPLEMEGEPVEIGFNGRYLADILAVLPGPRLRIALKDGGSPALITTPDQDGWEAVLMPMRV
ncbi:DNA polymerase III subunit beta [Xanthobacter sp. TB0139]|uniref:DNA polymerase III subunit beta n=1 Tax=Xanthobacter sp. TB0139 TaxID=3459178 RepID=UPI0040391114